MQLQQAKETVLEAVNQLVTAKLVARTWGNISCRVGSDQFLITPSGKAYDRLTMDQLVLVSCPDLSYTGSIKPSSEKAIHALVYQYKPEVACVIHTHQEMASLASLLGGKLAVPEHDGNLMGTCIHTARYGLPGTRQLRCQVQRVLNQGAKSALLMANHGALCYGASLDETFLSAAVLERICRQLVFSRSPLLKTLEGKKQIMLLAEKHESGTIAWNTTIAGVLKSFCTQLMYRKADCRYILLLVSEEVLAVTKTMDKVYAYLDDFAQIAGPSIAVLHPHASIPSSAFHTDALLCKEYGALCMGSSKADAEAVAMLVQKNCKAALFGLGIPAVQPLAWLDTQVMRFVYKHSYAKRAEEDSRM